VAEVQELVKICPFSRVCGERAAEGQRSHASGANAVAAETVEGQLSTDSHIPSTVRGPLATILLTGRGILPKSQLAN
jgi:hypothetical protein